MLGIVGKGVWGLRCFEWHGGSIEEDMMDGETDKYSCRWCLLLAHRAREDSVRSKGHFRFSPQIDLES